jgi:hypothetical protein
MSLRRLISKVLLRGLLKCIDECVEHADPEMKCCASTVCPILCWMKLGGEG